MRAYRLGVIVAALAALAGCASSPPEPSGRTAAPTTVTSASPTTTRTTPAALSTAQAAKRYLTIVAPYNRALERLEKAFNSGQPVATLNELAEATADANAVHIRKLRATRWPASVREPIRRLVAESGAAQRYLRQAATAGSRDGVLQAMVAFGEHSGSGPAGQVRRLLKLDKYDEDDYG